MTSSMLQKAREFIYLNARLIDRQIFAYLFENGPKTGVLSALRAYQNPDGGFGNALEADLRTPAGQPLAVERAWIALDLINDFSDPMVLRACDWLQSVTLPEGGVAFALPTLEGYPHTPWMAAEPVAQLNPTASLCGFLLKHGVQHPWVERAAQFCWERIPSFESEAFHDWMPILEFLTHTPTRRAEAEVQIERIRTLVARPGMVTLDPDAQGYVKFPLHWAPTPASPLRPIFSQEIIQQHLNALAQRQQADGGWPISWMALSPASEMEWRGWVTIESLLCLRAYGYALN